MCQRRKYLEQISIASFITALKQGFQCALLAVRHFYKFSSENRRRWFIQSLEQRKQYARKSRFQLESPSGRLIIILNFEEIYLFSMLK